MLPHAPSVQMQAIPEDAVPDDTMDEDTEDPDRRLSRKSVCPPIGSHSRLNSSTPDINPTHTPLSRISSAFSLVEE